MELLLQPLIACVRPPRRRIRFQAQLLDTVEQAVIATDLSGIVAYWCRFAETLYGWPAAEALGRSITDLNVVATFVCLGRDNAPALVITDDVRSHLGSLTVACGGIGTRLGQLRRWLSPHPGRPARTRRSR
jgi:PAS domain-containing protein